MSRNRNSPCADCAGGPACADCPVNPENGVPAKLYTPKGAVRAMLAGKVLKNKNGCNVAWNKDFNCFLVTEPDSKKTYTIGSFSGLFSDGA